MSASCSNEIGPRTTATHNEAATWTRIAVRGSSTQAKGVVKELAGKALGDAKLTAEGRSDRAKGKLQSAIGGLKDALKKQ
jgi:uncharacterized protein YjbJ (UPF0337 family)